MLYIRSKMMVSFPLETWVVIMKLHRFFGSPSNPLILSVVIFLYLLQLLSNHTKQDMFSLLVSSKEVCFSNCMILMICNSQAFLLMMLIKEVSFFYEVCFRPATKEVY